MQPKTNRYNITPNKNSIRVAICQTEKRDVGYGGITKITKQIGEEEVFFSASIDDAYVRQMARKAALNKSGLSKMGGVVVHVIKRARIS